MTSLDTGPRANQSVAKGCCQQLGGAGGGLMTSTGTRAATPSRARNQRTLAVFVPGRRRAAAAACDLLDDINS
jgi:hypothetical protein